MSLRIRFYSTAMKVTLIAAFLTASCAYGQSLRGHWRFDEGTGVIAGDISGNQNGGTLLAGATWATGTINGSIDLDGLNDFVSIDSAPLAMETWTGLTVSAWVRNDDGAVGKTHDIASWWDFPSSPSWVLTHHKNDQYFFEISGKAFLSGGAVSTNWTHVAGTYDGSAMRLYVNGVEVDSSTGLSGPLPVSTANLIIGTQQDFNNHFDGLIDDVRIYDDALSSQAILDLYNAVNDLSAPSTPTGLAPDTVEATSVLLSWNASADPESGITAYAVYRDSLKIAETPGLSFQDSGLSGDTSYSYQVSAINGNGLESPLAAVLPVTTPPDLDPPSVDEIRAREYTVDIDFNKELDPATASDPSKYSVNNGISVSTASLNPSGRSVTLVMATPHIAGTSYELTVSGVESLSGIPIPSTIFPYTPTILSTFLLAHWKFDETSGLTVVDDTGNGHDGTVSGSSIWTGGYLDGALELDGETASVSVDPVPMDMDSLSAFTVMAWVRNHLGQGVDTNDIIGWWSFPPEASWILTHHSNDQYFFEIAGKGVVTGGTVSTEWTHVAATYDGSTMRLYQDGVEVASESGLSGTLLDTTSPLVIGGQGNGTKFFDGRIDDVRIYALDLTGPEISDIFADTNSIRVPDTTPPSVPGNFLAESVTESTVTLTWDPSVDMDSGIDRYDIFRDGSKVGETTTTTFTETGLTALTAYTYQVFAVNDWDLSAGSVILPVNTPINMPPVVTVWYGSNQQFGNRGTPQVWINILGNVQDETPVASLTYSLNAGPPRTLSVGEDNRRLARTGDFNIDLDIGDVLDGTNEVVITAIDAQGLQTVETMTFAYDSGNVWPLPYSVDWSTVTDIQDAVKVVDGNFAITQDGIRILEVDYDRVLNLGDLIWENYEITVPMTIHGFEPGYLGPESVSAGFGITMRWTGHTDDPVSCGQPKCGWKPSGAGAWYDLGRGGFLSLSGALDRSVVMVPGETWYWKLRAETVAGGSQYHLKVWRDYESEPVDWNIERFKANDMSLGSVILNCHHSDITFGNILVVPLGSSIDTTPPTVPENLSTTSITAFEVALTWDPSDDPESGVDHYDIYRDGIKVGESTTNSFTDSSPVSLTGYDYSVVAVNGDAVSSAASTTLEVMTLELELDLMVRKATNGSFMELTVNSVAGARIRLERSDAGYAGPWNPVDPALPVPLPTASIQITDSEEMQPGDFRLYRAVEITDP